MSSRHQTDAGVRLPSHELVIAASGRLQQNPYLAVRTVSCECDRGVLVLRGRLSTFYQKQVAQEAVAGLRGVEQVVNEIEVDG